AGGAGGLASRTGGGPRPLGGGRSAGRGWPLWRGDPHPAVSQHRRPGGPPARPGQAGAHRAGYRGPRADAAAGPRRLHAHRRAGGAQLLRRPRGRRGGLRTCPRRLRDLRLFRGLVVSAAQPAPAPAPRATAFSPRTILALVLVGVVSFSGLAVLAAYAPELR